MTRRISFTILLLSSVAAFPAFAQEAATTAAATTVQSIDDLPEDEAEGEEIVVQGQRPRGSVAGDIPPEVLMSLPSPEEIQRRADEAKAKAQAALAAQR